MKPRAVAGHTFASSRSLSIMASAVGVALAMTLVPLGSTARAQEEEETPPALLLIMDSSGSMRASAGGETKIQAAKDALKGVVEALPDDSLVGLRVYGHRIPNTDKKRGCKDTELIVPVGPLDRSDMKREIASFDAKGFTPIGLSLEEGAKDLPPEGERTIVLVSDGIDTCAPPPPCKIAKKVVKEGVDLRIDTIGFQVDPRARRDLQCIARVAKGSYFDARSAAELADRLSRQSLRALRRFEATGTAVTGGASATNALPLESGQFTDTISPSEKLFYAVEVAEGQALGASASAVGKIDFLGTLKLELLDPDQQFVDYDAVVATGERLQSIAVETETIDPGAANPSLQSPGRFYLVLSLDSQGDPNAEYPVELLVEVTGDPVAPSPTEQPDDGEGTKVASGDDESSGGNTTMLILGGIVFGLLGAALGALAGKKVLGR